MPGFELQDKVTLQAPFTQGEAHVEAGTEGVILAIYPSGLVDVDFLGEVEIPEFDEGILKYPTLSIPKNLLKNHDHEERQMAEQEAEPVDGKKASALSSVMDLFIAQGSSGDFVRFANRRTNYPDETIETWLKQGASKTASDDEDCDWCGEPMGDEDAGEVVKDGKNMLVHAEPCYNEAISSGAKMAAKTAASITDINGGILNEGDIVLWWFEDDQESQMVRLDRINPDGTAQISSDASGTDALVPQEQLIKVAERVAILSNFTQVEDRTFDLRRN